MKVKVFGIEKKQYDMSRDGGPKFDGYYIHGERIDAVVDGLVGHLPITIKLDKSHPYYADDIAVGRVYLVSYDDKKKLDFIMPDAAANK